LPTRLQKFLRRTPVLGKKLIRAELEQRYAAVFGRKPRIDAPSGFNERMLHRIVYDRDPRLKTLCDKLAMREFIRERAGADFVVPLLGVWDDAASIAWKELPPRFVLKPNHSSGPVAIVRTDADRDPAALAAKAAEWLREDFFDVNLEWGYRDLPRRVFAEPLLAGPDGGPPPEVHVMVFHGKAACICVLTGRKLTPGRRENWFDPCARPMPMSAAEPIGEFVLTAKDAAAVVLVAERTAAGFDHLRVDTYLTDAGVKIGELSPYASAGRAAWQPPEWDDKLGRLWA